ncbi:DUF3291 domain-containing protein [Jannaschia seohaensis]|uniref:Uncharacterized protein DUF3291 n=1 Tax=Jannaschia seohaensis TaxID=475081 RepID=A0A2Y9A7P0_9RHOB|nr:DUF3291 domain-containing protein [Jannaschia seohaensis]PWJ21919.1 uncharacterized protein DUF3291 [Jannaschia seohaensis]SSA38197.1 protein of unknown function [Jannaschia seohaensis]
MRSPSPSISARAQGEAHRSARPAFLLPQGRSQDRPGSTLAEPAVGDTRPPLDDARMAGFMETPDRTNALAERNPGFVWRMRPEGGSAAEIALPGDAEVIPNLSVRTGIGSPAASVFNALPARSSEMRAACFDPMAPPPLLLWSLPERHVPTREDAMDRLSQPRAPGATDHAFGRDAVETSACRICTFEEVAP